MQKKMNFSRFFLKNLAMLYFSMTLIGVKTHEKRIFLPKNLRISKNNITFASQTQKQKEMKKLLSILLFIFLALAPVERVCADVTTADGRVLTEEQLDSLRLTPEFVTASLLVAEPTDWRDDLMGVLGHAFIRLQCPTFDFDLCFSYECEPVKNNWWRFLTGDLKMGMFRYTTDSQMAVYQEWHRSIHEYQLNLPPEAETRLWEIMDNHVNNNILLPMDMYKRGCAISLVHFVTEALGETKIEYAEWPEEFSKTQKEIILDALDDYPFIRMGARMFVLDNRFKKNCPPEEKLVIPAMLADVWSCATINGAPLLTDKGELVKP